MRQRLQLWLRGVVKLIAVVVVASAAGLALGIGLSALVGGDSSSQASPPSGAKAQMTPAVNTVRLRAVSTILHRDLTPSGQHRNGARLAVHVRVTNHGKRTIANVAPVLVAGTGVRADSFPGEATGSLLRPVPPGSTADGTLRFETAGAVTTRLVSTRRAQLRIAGRTVTPTVKIGGPMQSGQGTR